MKKILLGTIISLVSLAGYSQVRWDVKAGMSMSNMTQLDEGPKFGYTVGVGADYAFNNLWSLQTGINFTSKGTRESDSERGEKETFQVFSHYAELPVLAAVNFQIVDNIKFIINAGPYFALGLGGKQEYTNTRFPDDNYSISLFKGENGEKALMKRFDMGLQYGIGTEINKHLLVNLTGQCGFITPYNSPYNKTFGDDGKSPLNLSFNVTLGYRF